MKVEQILRYVLYAGLFGILFIPFIVSSDMFFPFITGKNFTFRIVVEVLLGAWVLLALIDARYRPQYSHILGSVGLFVGVMFLANIFAENPFKAFWSNFERMDGWVTLIHMFAYLLVASTVLAKERLFDAFLKTSVGVSVLIGAFGLLQLAGFFTINQGGDRLDATFGNSTYLAVYMLFHLFITALLVVRHQGAKVMYYVYGLIMLLQVVILFFTGTRGTILGVIGGILLTGLLMLFFSKGKPIAKRIGVGAIIGVLVLLGGFVAIKDTAFVQDNFILNRFADISLEAGQARFMVWNAALQGASERPILGWGQEGFNFVFNTYYDPGMFAQEPWFDRTHNFVFDWLIAGGMLGLLSYLLIPVAALYYLWLYRREDDLFMPSERSILTGLLAAYFFHNLFVFDNLMSYVMFMVVLAIIHVGAIQRKAYQEIQVQDVKDGTMTLAAPVVVVLTVAVVYFVNVPGINTSLTLISALNQQETIDDNLNLFREALEYNSVGRQEVREQFLQTAVLVGQSQLPNEVKTVFLQESVAAMNEEIERVPNDARLNILLGSTLSRFGLYEEALPYIERARELSPKKQAILFQLGEYYLRLGDIAQAEEIMREAFLLEEEYDEARILYALVLTEQGKSTEVEALLVPRFGTIAVDDDRLLNAYAEQNWYGAVLEIWEARVVENPENAQIRVSYAATLAAIGRTTDAIQELQTAIELNPDFTEQGNVLIQQLRAGGTL